MGPDIIYVSGRMRKPGEMNGKSANLNNCLSHIYPVGTPIPPNEITCIFDADQVRVLCRPAERGRDLEEGSWTPYMSGVAVTSVRAA